MEIYNFGVELVNLPVKFNDVSGIAMSKPASLASISQNVQSKLFIHWSESLRKNTMLAKFMKYIKCYYHREQTSNVVPMGI